MSTKKSKVFGLILGLFFIIAISTVVPLLFYSVSPVYAQVSDSEPWIELKLEEVTEPIDKFVSTEATDYAALLDSEPMKKTPIPEPVVRTASSNGSSSSNSSGDGGSSSSGQSAQSILNSYIAKYPILKGTTVSYGDTKGYQAITYYKSGRIIISKNHTASLQRIIAHEVWHVIDWRDNGKIDWGENVPR